MGSKAELQEVLRFFDGKRLKPVVYKTLPLEEAAVAQRIMEESEHFGKIVLTI
jgi:zinc-binding alcohol dehydrogenase/oxidoreductase